MLRTNGTALLSEFDWNESNDSQASRLTRQPCAGQRWDWRRVQKYPGDRPATAPACSRRFGYSARQRRVRIGVEYRRGGARRKEVTKYRNSRRPVGDFSRIMATNGGEMKDIKEKILIDKDKL